jgi:tetratricopeptide (TPR) repeat protein
MRQIAADNNLPYFLAGSFAATDTAVEATVQLYETRRAKLLSERRYYGTDVFSMADEVSVVLKHDLGIPKQHIDEVEDLPLVERLTSSEAAYRKLVEGYVALTVDRDWPAALTALQASVEADPSNAYAHLIRYGASVLGNDQPAAVQALEDVMQHLYKLPERTQYQTKFQYYDYRGEAEKATAVLKMWVDVLPDDIEGRASYATLLVYRDRRPEAVEQYQKILEIDPTRTEFLQVLGNLTQSMGDFDRATAYFERYTEEFPDKPESHLALGQLLRLQGRFEEAKVTFERALLVDPENVAALINLASLERRFGNFDAAVTGLHAVIEQAKTVQDSASVYGSLANAYQYRGQIQQALEYRDQALTLQAAFIPPISVLRARLELLDDYISVDREAEARQLLTTIEGQMQPPFDAVVAYGYMNIALELEQPDSVEAAVDRIQSFIDSFGLQILQPDVNHARGRALEMRERYEEAIASYRAELQATPTDISVHTDIGRCQRKLGQLDEAQGSFQRSLAADPYSPFVHYQLALLHEARGDAAAAVQHLETTLEVWANADPLYKPAIKARDKLAELR